MGISPSKQQSYLQYDNDFELVIRATKDLEYLLETEFGAPSTKQTGLHDKISHAQNYAGLSQDTVKKMRYLVTCKWKVGATSVRVCVVGAVPMELLFVWIQILS